MLMAYQLKHERTWRVMKIGCGAARNATVQRGSHRDLGREKCKNDLLNFQLREIQFILFQQRLARKKNGFNSRKTKNCQLTQRDGSIARSKRRQKVHRGEGETEMEKRDQYQHQYVCVWIVCCLLTFFFCSFQLNWPFKRAFGATENKWT